MKSSKMSFAVSLQFEKAQLPPFSDILLLGRKSPIGMSGIAKSLEYLVPNNFDIIPVDNETVEAMVVNKAILKRMPVDELVKVLEDAVFPYMSEEEIMKVDFSVRITYEGQVAWEAKDR